MRNLVVHSERAPYDVFIGRPTKWGNPFILRRNQDREQVIRLYINHLVNTPELLKSVLDLRGKVLGCYCHPKKCHGDVLAYLANMDTIPFMYLIQNTPADLVRHLESKFVGSSLSGFESV